MAIEFICPACQGTLSMADDAAGRLVRCGNCQATLRVPDAPPARSAYEPDEPRPKRPDPRMKRYALADCDRIAGRFRHSTP